MKNSTFQQGQDQEEELCLGWMKIMVWNMCLFPAAFQVHLSFPSIGGSRTKVHGRLVDRMLFSSIWKKCSDPRKEENLIYRSSQPSHPLIGFRICRESAGLILSGRSPLNPLQLGLCLSHFTFSFKLVSRKLRMDFFAESQRAIRTFFSPSR